MISDNSVNLRDTINATGVACIGWTGAVRFFGDYCFTVANGDIPAESTMCANWCFQQGHKKVGFFWERGSSGTDYADYFRRAAQNVGLEIIEGGLARPEPAQHRSSTWPPCATQGAEAIVYVGYGYSTFHFARAFKALDWDPPRIMGTAFMFYSNSNAWAEGLEGWHGVDQLGEDGQNPNYEAMLERFEARFGRISRNVVVALAYDTARAGDPRHRQRADRHPGAGEDRPRDDQVDALHERRARPPTSRSPPTTTAGYKGDFLTIRELRGGELHLQGLLPARVAFQHARRRSSTEHRRERGGVDQRRPAHHPVAARSSTRVGP